MRKFVRPNLDSYQEYIRYVLLRRKFIPVGSPEYNLDFERELQIRRLENDISLLESYSARERVVRQLAIRFFELNRAKRLPADFPSVKAALTKEARAAFLDMGGDRVAYLRRCMNDTLKDIYTCTDALRELGLVRVSLGEYEYVDGWEGKKVPSNVDQITRLLNDVSNSRYHISWYENELRRYEKMVSQLKRDFCQLNSAKRSAKKLPSVRGHIKDAALKVANNLLQYRVYLRTTKYRLRTQQGFLKAALDALGAVNYPLPESFRDEYSSK